MAIGGHKAWEVFGQMSLRGMGNVRSQIGEFEGAAERGAGTAAGFAGTLSRAAAGFAIMGLAAAAFAVESVRAFSEFEGAMNQSLAIMGDVTAEVRRDMEDTARSVAKTTMFSANDAAEAYFFLASAGMSAEESIEALPAVSQFAQAGMFNMAKATDILTDAQSALGMTIRDDAVANMENMVHISDVLVKANTIANASVQQFGEALINRAAPRMRQFGVEVEEGVAVLAAFADQGVKSRLAGMQLNILLRDLTRTALDKKEAFKALGIEVFNADGSIRNMADIIEDFERVLGGATDEQRVMVFETIGLNQRVADALSTLLGMSGAIREYEAALREAGGTTEDVANRQLEGFRAQLGLIGSAFRDMFLAVGRVLTPLAATTLRPIAAVLTELADLTKLWADEWIRFGRIIRFELDWLWRVIPIIPQIYDIALAQQRRLTEEHVRTGEAHSRVITGVLDSLREITGLHPEIGSAMLQLFRAGELTEAQVLRIEQLLREDLPLGATDFMLAVRGDLLEIPEEFAEAFEDASEEVQHSIALLSQFVGKERLLRMFIPEEDEETVDDVKDTFSEIEEILRRLREGTQDEEDALDNILNIASDTRTLLSAQRDLRRADLKLILEMVDALDEIEEHLKNSELSYKQQAAALREIKELREDISEFLILDPATIPNVIQTMPQEQLREWTRWTRRFGKLTMSNFGRGMEEEAPSSLKDTLDNIRPDLERAGARLIESILTGSFGARDLFRIGINLLARRFIMPAILDAFGIGSPSKPMVEVGRILMDSVAMGIQQNAQAPANAIRQVMGSTFEATNRLAQSPAARQAALAGMGGRLVLDVSGMTPAGNPLAAARDEKWQEFLRESQIVAKNDGFRM